MKTIFDKEIRDSLIGRINNLNEQSQAQWGKMNVYQMLKHCRLAEELYLGKKKYKRAFLGRLIGQMALKNMLKDETPMSRNAPTSGHFIVTESSGDMEAERKQWVTFIQEYERF